MKGLAARMFCINNSLMDSGNASPMGSAGLDPQQVPAADIPLLAGLPAASLERLLAAARIQRFERGKLMFAEGEIPREQQIVLSGIVDLARLEGGRECTTMMMSAGDVLALAAALSNEPFLVSARALTIVRILAIETEAVRAEALRTPVFAMNMVKVLSGQWRVAHRIILDLKCRSPSQRLAAFLLRLHDSSRPGTIPEIPFSKRQLAARIGMQPETLSRTLQTLAANGLHLRGHQIILLDRDKIKAFCGPDPYPSGNEHGLGVYAL
jgi:CRP/FNR family transcriptional activator FtrB